MDWQTAVNKRKIPAQARSKVLVSSLLEATAHILKEEGYAAISTNKVAERAGVSIGSLYQYFPHKKSLVGNLFLKHSHEVKQEICSSVFRASHDLYLSVKAAVQSMVRHHQEDLKFHQMLHYEIPHFYDLEQYRMIKTEVFKTMYSCYLKFGSFIQRSDLKYAAQFSVHLTDSMVHNQLIENSSNLQTPQFASDLSEVIYSFLRKGSQISLS